MSRFGDLISGSLPVVVIFESGIINDHNTLHYLIQELSEFREKVTFRNIHVCKNEELCSALRIKTLPFVIIYLNGEQIWRNKITNEYWNQLKENLKDLCK